MSVASLLTSLAGPIAKRALSALGIGVISYAAVATAFDAVKSQLLSLYGQMSGDIIWIAERAGLAQALGIILGAIAAKVGLMALTRLGKLQA